jgi:phosphoadenosine phosphosulfate reductase
MPPARMDDADIALANELLGQSPPPEILRWAVKHFHPDLLMATAFGAEGCCLLHMLAEIGPGTKVINLDTGYQFAETLELAERVRAKYGIETEFVRPELTVPEYEADHGGPMYDRQPDQCCHDRKVLPLRQAMRRIAPRAWVSAIRKDQTADRAAAGVVQWDAKFGVVKVNPLLNWTKGQVWKFVLDNDVPYNPLHDRGYPSVGCWPCTRAVAPGEDDRAGRWSGKEKKECGLHVLELKDGSGI